MATKKTTTKTTSASKPKKSTSTPRRPTKKNVSDRLVELMRQIKELQAEYEKLRAAAPDGEAQEDQVDSDANKK